MEAAKEAQNIEAFRQAVVNTLERCLFYIPSFKIYHGVAGLYDYGPPGCAVKSNVLAFSRLHFVLEENILEVYCPCVTPEVVLKASGHVDKFTDLMVKDEKIGTCYRDDHLLKDFCKDKLERDPNLPAEKAAKFTHVLAVLDDLSSEELGAKIKEYGITTPDPRTLFMPLILSTSCSKLQLGHLARVLGKNIIWSRPIKCSIKEQEMTQVFQF